MSDHFQRLSGLLRELFQLDQPDLDFGLYRIMHARADEISQFLDKDLLPQVQEAFKAYQSADKAGLEKKLEKAVEQAKALGADPATLPKVKELKERLAALGGLANGDQLERETFDHLFGFFRRYYDEGDFLSRRVYKQGVYAIPYEGEEVKLHWANKDQYYIKTSEYLRDFAFKLRPDDAKNPMRVHLRLVDAAEGEHNNVKTAKEKERRFILAKDNAVVEEAGELVIRFEYRAPMESDFDGAAPKQAEKTRSTLNARAEQAVLASTDAKLAPWIQELQKKHVNANGAASERSRLAVKLDRYTARNTFDYFIHKDLGGFLRNELDFYIKNEIMHLDDVESDTAPRVEQYLSKIRVTRKIAGKIIDFLSQLEDFQKKLWLKKKFVVETQYCITLDRIPESFYPEIAANEAQREEWVELFAIDEIKKDTTTVEYSKPLKVDFLKSQPFLVVDTKHFDEGFKALLLNEIQELDEKANGLLVHSDNFQALNFLKARNLGSIDFIYIDPPYNTDATEIVYKNGYKESSWLALISSRLSLGHSLLRDDGVHCFTIDDYEHAKARLLLDSEFGDQNYLATALIRNNPSGRSTVKGFSVNHEFALFYGAGSTTTVGRIPHSEEQRGRYDTQDETGSFEWENFRKSSAGSDRASRPKQHFPFYVAKKTLSMRVPKVEWMEASKSYKLCEDVKAGEIIVWPLDDAGKQKVWRWGIERTLTKLPTLEARQVGERIEIYGRKYLNQRGILPRTWWDKSEYSARDNGTRVLRDMFSSDVGFDFPKAVEAVKDSIRIGCPLEEGTVLDYFGGSATTAHAVIELNREADNQRKFILAEMGIHFDTVFLPRIKKATYSHEWKNSKPIDRNGISHCFKYIRLESYEDALNNLALNRSKAQASLLDQPAAQGPDKLREQYMLRYMLDSEAAGSASLLNIDHFADPTAYTLTVKTPGSDESRAVAVDLLETFNYLIGLWVDHIAAPVSFTAKFKRDSEKRLVLDGKLTQSPNGPFWFRKVEGVTRKGQKTLVIWRKLTGQAEEDNLALDHFMRDRLKINTKDFEFDVIYVNGDNNLENLRQADEKWKVRLIEEDFHALMFDIGSL